MSKKTFSNSRKCGTVRRRAVNYLSALGVKEIPLAKAIEKFSELTDMFDRYTIKAYFGTKKHTSRKLIFRRAIYGGNGTVSNKTIDLSQDVPTTAGYLEKLGLVDFEKRGKTWFMVVNENAVLIPQLYERKQLPMKNISLSTNSENNEAFSQGERVRENRFEKVVSVNNKINNNNLQDERDIFVDKTAYGKLTPLERAILRAESSEEPDRSQTNWRKQALIIPELEEAS
jgi:hypothetical protein